MILEKLFLGFMNKNSHLLAALLILPLLTGTVWAQVTASITGAVKDSSGAVVPGAMVTVKHLESGLTRTAEADSSGSYSVLSLPVGQYEVSAERAGFKQELRRGINLVVAQQAVVNLTLEVGNVEQQVTVTAEAPIVNTTLSSTSGLIGEKELKDLPLNGRSFDQLLTLNVGIVNYSSNYSHVGSIFSVAGRRPEENRFLLNGVEYAGTDGSADAITPYGSSGQLLGVDAVREFNVVQHTYGAEYGKRAGGQVSIVTSSGTNQLHGDVFEYLRNSVLDARNFFDPAGVPPFKRNQFGGALGGPLKKDKLFLFGNYEGFRQRLGLTSVAAVPDELARQGYLPIGPNNTEVLVPDLQPGMLPFAKYFWPAPNGRELGGGVALAVSNPLQKIREDFGLTRFDYNASTNDSLSATYLMDDGENDLPQADPIFLQFLPQRSQLLGLQETHVFSPTVLNVATVGFTRVKFFEVTVPTTPIPSNLLFVSGSTPGIIQIGAAGGGGASSAAIVATASNGQAPHGNARNFFTWSDDLRLTKGSHSLSAGLWIQRNQLNLQGSTTTQSGPLSYPTLLAFLQDRPTQLLVIPNQSELLFRTTQAAWYVQDEIKLRPNLSLRLGLRDELTTGYNEAVGHCSNYIFDHGVIQSDPLIGSSCLTQNNALALWQPRAGLAWDPTGTGKWAVRAGFGIFNSLQDNLASRFATNPPFQARLTLTGPVLSQIPVPSGVPTPPPCNAELKASGAKCSTVSPNTLEPDFHTPTIQQWSFTVEREITKDLALQLGYVGSQAYHLMLNMNANTIHPQVCADPRGCVSGGAGAARATVPQGTEYVPPGTLPNPFVGGTTSWFFENNSSYHGLTVSLVKRASHGLIFKTNYTFAKALDLNSAPKTSFGTNEPTDVVTPYDLKLSKGLASYNLRHQFNANFSYELPFGPGKRWGGSAGGVEQKLIGGWQWNAILTAQSGFPFTPRAGSNVSGNGDTQNNPDSPNWNPAFHGRLIVGTPNLWYDPNAFAIPAAGTFGNVGRSTLFGPGLVDFDTSLFKSFSLNERWNLQFRAEVFNLLNHANFIVPNAVVFSGARISPSAGIITGTANASRQIQFALKLTF